MATEVEEIIARADALDQRRQQQIERQKASIDRLLAENKQLKVTIRALQAKK